MVNRANYRTCIDRHTAIGTIGFPPIEENRPLFRDMKRVSLPTCGSEKCMRSANRVIKSLTGFNGYFAPRWPAP